MKRVLLRWRGDLGTDVIAVQIVQISRRSLRGRDPPANSYQSVRGHIGAVVNGSAVCKIVRALLHVPLHRSSASRHGSRDGSPRFGRVETPRTVHRTRSDPNIGRGRSREAGPGGESTPWRQARNKVPVVAAMCRTDTNRL